MMPIASCTPFPFSAPCDDMLTMLICAIRWLYMHLYALAYMPMHESYLLVCCPYFNTMKLWIPDQNLHFSLVDATFCLLFCLFAFSPIWLLSCFSACHVYHAYMLYASFIYSTHLFLSIACLLISCSCLRMYTNGEMMHEARAWSPRHKQKGQGCKHVDIIQVAVFSRFRSLAFPLWFYTL